MRLPLLLAAVALALPASATAAPPPNDNYLASTIVTNSQAGSLPIEWTDPAPPDTLEATTQADLFNPDQSGAPGSGGGAEPLTCGGATIGKTVWYDLHPPTWGGVDLTVSGFDVAVGVYKWDPDTNRITKTVRCQNSDASTSEELLFNVSKGSNYTVQVGGVNGAGGQLAFKLFYFRDSDHDLTVDEHPDECRLIPGTRGDGCPPTVTGSPRYANVGRRLTMLLVQNVQKGSTVEASCSGCGKRFRKTARRSGTVKVKSFAGRTISAGGHLVVRIRHKATGRGRFKFGAFGLYYSYKVTDQGIGKRTDRCLNPGSRIKVNSKKK